MDVIHTEMLAICDRLLTLMTGKDPLEGIDKDVALDAIELLGQLEICLKHSASTPLPPQKVAALALLRHRARVLEHLQPVIELLVARGWLPTAH